jgi:hypothetical protein
MNAVAVHQVLYVRSPLAVMLVWFLCVLATSVSALKLDDTVGSHVNATSTWPPDNSWMNDSTPSLLGSHRVCVYVCVAHPSTFSPFF